MRAKYRWPLTNESGEEGYLIIDNIFISAACVPASECRQYEADQERLGQELNYNFIYLRGKGREATLFGFLMPLESSERSEGPV